MNDGIETSDRPVRLLLTRRSRRRLRVSWVLDRPEIRRGLRGDIERARRDNGGDPR